LEEKNPKIDQNIHIYYSISFHIRSVPFRLKQIQTKKQQRKKQPRQTETPATYLSRAETHREIGDERVLGLARPVAHHHAPAAALRQRARLERLAHAADLVDLEQQAVARAPLHRRADARHIGHGQVVADHLDGGARREFGPRGPVVLVEGVLDRDDRVFGDHVRVDAGKSVR